ncbi:MAG: YitT family protein, partial [Firmicutes bacterium]|nr:YitT family protein [Bacillota bacterium]
TLAIELLLMNLTGFLARKTKLVQKDFAAQLTSFLMKICLPCLIFRSVSSSTVFSLAALQESGIVILIAAVVMLLSFLVGQVAFLLARRSGYGRVLRFGLIFPHFSSMGIPVVQALFGDMGLFYYSFFLIPVRIAYYSFYEPLMTPVKSGSSGKKLGEIVKSSVTNPCLIAVAVGLVFWIAGWQLPTVLDYCVKSLVYVLVFSGANILLQSIDLSAFIYYNQNGNSAILGPAAAGVIAGAVNGLAIHNNGSTGGTDIIAAYLHVRKPGYSLVWVIFVLNASVAFMSYFVYGFRFEPVIMCIIYSYLIAAVSDRMLRGMKKAYKFEVITDRGEELSDELIRELRHGVTVLHAEGMYSRSDKDLLICIVNRQQLVHFRRILSRYPGSFSYVTEVAETVGNFKNVKEN